MLMPDSNTIAFNRIFDKVQSFTYDHFELRKQKYYDAFYHYMNVFEKFTSEAMRSGVHTFAPFTAQIRPKRDKGIRVFLKSSFLDRLFIFSVIQEIGSTIQHEIDELVNSETMPIPPAASFLAINNPYPYTDWKNDYFLWQQIPEYYGFKGYSWYLQTDLQNFFDTIDTNTLLNNIQPYFKADNTYGLLKEYFDIKVHWNASIHNRPYGLPTGEPTSHLFANLYLLPFDKWVINQHIPYVRYVDDMRFFAHSKDECLRILDEITEYLLVTYNLKVNPEKIKFERIENKADINKANHLYNYLKHLQKVSRDLPFRDLIKYQKLTPSQLASVIDKLKRNALNQHDNKNVPITFGTVNSQNISLEEYAKYTANSDECEEMLYSFLDWILIQTPNSYITSLLRITVSKLSYFDALKTANKVKDLLKSELYAWRMVAVKAMLKTLNNSFISNIENYLLDLLSKNEPPVKEIKHILSLMYDHNVISNSLIEKIKAIGNKELVNHILPAINTAEELISMMKQNTDFEFLESAAIQIYKLRTPLPEVFEYWKNTLIQPHLSADFKSYLIIWSEFLSEDYEIKSFIYDHIDHFTRFEIALFKESLIIAKKLNESANNKDRNTFDVKKYTDAIITRIEETFDKDERDEEKYLF